MNIIHLDHHRAAREIAVTLTAHAPDLPALRGVPPDAIAGGPEPFNQGHAWAHYGFTRETAEAWLAAGVYEPSVAAELVLLKVSPLDRGWSVEIAGMSLGVAVSEAEITVGECLSYLERGELVAWGEVPA